MSNFIDDLNKILEKEVLSWPEDKQKHFFISKSLIAAVYPKSENISTMILEIIFMIYYIGINKELGDKAIDPMASENIKSIFEDILSKIKDLDTQISLHKLDNGDLNADLMGTIFGTLLNIKMNKGF